MTRDEARHWLEIELKLWEDECKSKHPIKEALGMAIKELEQEPVIDKIKAEIANHLQIMDICNVEEINGVIIQSELVNKKVVLYDSVMRIIDKYKGESEGE